MDGDAAGPGRRSARTATCARARLAAYGGRSRGPAGFAGPVFRSRRRRIKVMPRRAVLLGARTRETVELRADLRALTRVVLTLVDQRIRARVSVSDEAFLKNAADAGAAIHAAARGARGGRAIVPTPPRSRDAARRRHVDPPKAARGRGKVERKPKPNPDGVATDETKTPKKRVLARRRPFPPGRSRTRSSCAASRARATRNAACLPAGQIPRPKGRAEGCAVLGFRRRFVRGGGRDAR